MANDTKRIGKKYRILTNAATRAWDVISFWTSSHDVEMDDGNTLEDNLGGIKGIITEKTNQPGYVMDASVVSEMQNNIEAVPTSVPIYDPSLKYAKGDLRNYNGSIYYCTTDINNPEEWNSSHWNLVTSPIRLQLGIDENGNYGYIKAGADSVTPFKKAAAYALSDQLSPGTYYINIAGWLTERHISINYKTLTNDNFILQHIRNNTSVSGGTTDYGIHQGAPRPTAGGSDFSFNYNSSTGILTIDGGSVRYAGQFGIGSLVRYEEGWMDYHTENAYFNYTVNSVVIPWLVIS